MNFWQILRWIGSALFICLLLFAWLSSDLRSPSGHETLHPAPVFNH